MSRQNWLQLNKDDIHLIIAYFYCTFLICQACSKCFTWINSSSGQPYEGGITVIVILQMKELRFRQVKLLAQDYTANKLGIKPRSV